MSFQALALVDMLERHKHSHSLGQGSIQLLVRDAREGGSLRPPLFVLLVPHPVHRKGGMIQQILWNSIAHTTP